MLGRNILTIVLFVVISGQYQELLCLEDSGVSVQVARHLLHLVAHANEGVRKEFFIQVGPSLHKDK